MKTKTKVLGLVMAAVLLVTATIFGTMAYLTSTDEVKNTFTVGSVALTLDEVKVNPDGTADGTERVKTNTYKLIPGHSYTKDPTVHFAAGSEAAWLFVKVDNGIAAIESKAEDYTSIAAQITANGWSALGEAYPGIYYKEAGAAQAAADYPVFASFAIDGSTDSAALATYENASVNVTAYAVQKDGFDTAAAAWTATFGAPSANS